MALYCPFFCFSLGRGIDTGVDVNIQVGRAERILKMPILARGKQPRSHLGEVWR